MHMVKIFTRSSSLGAKRNARIAIPHEWAATDSGLFTPDLTHPVLGKFFNFSISLNSSRIFVGACKRSKPKRMFDYHGKR